jgi:hypothetical protein
LLAGATGACSCRGADGCDGRGSAAVLGAGVGPRARLLRPGLAGRPRLALAVVAQPVALVAPAPPAIAALLPLRLALVARVDLRRHRPVLVGGQPIGVLGVDDRGLGEIVAVQRAELLLLGAQRRRLIVDLDDLLGVAVGELAGGVLGRRFGRAVHRGLGDDLGVLDLFGAVVVDVLDVGELGEVHGLVEVAGLLEAADRQLGLRRALGRPGRLARPRRPGRTGGRLGGFHRLARPGRATLAAARPGGSRLLRRPAPAPGLDRAPPGGLVLCHRGVSTVHHEAASRRPHPRTARWTKNCADRSGRLASE